MKPLFNAADHPVLLHCVAVLPGSVIPLAGRGDLQDFPVVAHLRPADEAGLVKIDQEGERGLRRQILLLLAVQIVLQPHIGIVQESRQNAVVEFLQAPASDPEAEKAGGVRYFEEGHQYLLFLRRDPGQPSVVQNIVRDTSLDHHGDQSGDFHAGKGASGVGQPVRLEVDLQVSVAHGNGRLGDTVGLVLVLAFSAFRDVVEAVQKAAFQIHGGSDGERADSVIII